MPRRRSSAGQAWRVETLRSLGGGPFGLPLFRRLRRVGLLVSVARWLVMPVIGQETPRLGAEGVGVQAGMDGLGALLGAALVGLVAKPACFATLHDGGTMLCLGGMVACALAPGASMAELAPPLVGVGGAGFANMQASLVFLTAPVALRLRAHGVLSTAIGTGLLGDLQLEVLAEWLGAVAATALVGAEDHDRACPHLSVVAPASSQAMMAPAFRHFRMRCDGAGGLGGAAPRRGGRGERSR